MTISRQTFDIVATATRTDTGPPFQGAIHQIRWNAISGDTGGELSAFLQQRPEDTGDGVLVFHGAGTAGNLAVDFDALPRRVVSDTGLVASAPEMFDTIVSAGEHLRIRTRPGNTAVSGKLYVWTCDD
jgi:hypothetical protein